MTPENSQNCAIILAAGSGQRMAGVVDDKVLAKVGGKAVIQYSIEAFVESDAVGRIVLLYRNAAQHSALCELVGGISTGKVVIEYAPGGSSRQESVICGLAQLGDAAGLVFIHDGARPLVDPVTIGLLQQVAERDGAACLAHLVTDTIKRVPSDGRYERITPEDLDRSRLWAMETPQVFRAQAIQKAYRHVQNTGMSVTDDTAAANAINFPVTLVPNPGTNPKITQAGDLEFVDWLLSK